MIYTIVTLLIIGLTIFIISFFTNNRFEELEEQIEQLSISTLQDRYIMKNKIKVLEEELLTDQVDFYTPDRTNDEYVEKSQIHSEGEISLTERIVDLHNKGYTSKDIEQMVGINEEDIQAIINER